MTLLRHQPLKAIYVLFVLGFELIRLPYLILKYLKPKGRPHPDWTFQQALATRMVSSFILHFSLVQGNSPIPLAPGAEKERFVRIKPAASDLYKGPLRSNNDVQPAEIGATWYPRPLSAAEDKSNVKVMLHIHGGGFVLGDGRTQFNSYFAGLVENHMRCTHVMMPQYRVSTLPASKTSNPFPAAIQDTLTAYLYLLNDLHIAPENIVLSGDSAGGNASIALLRYIAEFGSELSLPDPSAALLWSPWINPSNNSGSFVYDNPHYHTDYLCQPFTKWSTAAYAGLGGQAVLSNLYVNHQNRVFKTPVPLWVNTGDAEVLFFDACEWAEKMREAGNHVTLDVEKKAPHDVMMIANLVGFHAEAKACAKRVGEWLTTMTT